MSISVDRITDGKRSAVQISHALNIGCDIHNKSVNSNNFSIKRKHIIAAVQINKIIITLCIDNVQTAPCSVSCVVQGIVLFQFCSQCKFGGLIGLACLHVI